MPEQDTTLELNEDEFWRIYEPLEMEDGAIIFNTAQEAKDFAKEKGLNEFHIWTISDGDNGWGAFCTPGFHMGGFGFVVTNAPHNEENVCGTWWEPDRAQGERRDEDDE